MYVYAYLNSFKCGLKEKDYKEFAKKHGLYIRELFSDDTLYNKDGLCRLFKQIAKSNIKTILVYSTDCLWTDEELHYLIIYKLKALDVEIKSITEPEYSVYTDTIEDNTCISDYVSMLTASYTAANLAKGRAEKAMKGKKPCGTAPYGYKWSEYNNIVVNDDEAQNLCTIFEMYLTLKSLGKLEEHLPKINIFNRHNKPFKKGVLSKILKNDYYVGYITYNGEKVKGKHKPIIDKQLFSDVGIILSENTKTTKI